MGIVLIDWNEHRFPIYQTLGLLLPNQRGITRRLNKVSYLGRPTPLLRSFYVFQGQIPRFRINTRGLLENNFASEEGAEPQSGL